MTALLDAQLHREAEASVALDKGDGQTQSFELERRDTAPTVPDPDEKQEIVIEPNLPTTEPSPTPAGPTPPDDDPELTEEQRLQLEMLAWVNLSVEEKAAAAYYAQVAAMDPSEIRWKAGNRAPRLQVGAYTLQPGEIVPGADAWPRRDAWERTGRIERA